MPGPIDETLRSVSVEGGKQRSNQPRGGHVVSLCRRACGAPSMSPLSGPGRCAGAARLMSIALAQAGCPGACAGLALRRCQAACPRRTGQCVRLVLVPAGDLVDLHRPTAAVPDSMLPVLGSVPRECLCGRSGRSRHLLDSTMAVRGRGGSCRYGHIRSESSDESTRVVPTAAAKSGIYRHR